jgi:Ca2+-binding EF-hand superfamily protein
MNITLNQLFEKMDADRNGQLSRDEFVMSMP